MTAIAARGADRDGTSGGPGSRWAPRPAALWSMLGVLAAVLLLRAFVADTVSVDSDSMTPTVCAGDRLLVLKAGASPDVGDVVVFDNPAEPGRSVKRVVAEAGQKVEIRDAVLYVDGLARAEDYVDLTTMDGTFFGPVRVPAGRVFVLGDHRELSIDSRDFGPLPLSALDGEVVGRLWSGCPD